MFDKIRLQIDLNNVKHDIDVIVKNSSESILLCDKMVDLNESQCGLEDNVIKPLVNMCLNVSYNNGEEENSDDSIKPIILHRNGLEDG